MRFNSPHPSNPARPAAGRARAGKGNPQQSFTFTHPNPAPEDVLTDVSGSFQWSLDLSQWNAPGATVSGTTVNIEASADDPLAGITAVTATILDEAPELLFVCAEATLD